MPVPWTRRLVGDAVDRVVDEAGVVVAGAEEAPALALAKRVLPETVRPVLPAPLGA